MRTSWLVLEAGCSVLRAPATSLLAIAMRLMGSYGAHVHFKHTANVNLLVLTPKVI